MNLRLTWTISALMLITASAASAQTTSALKGDYAFTGSAACLDSLSGFNPITLSPIADQAFQNSFAVQGIRHFNGDGTGTVQASEVTIVPPPTPPGVGVGASSATFSFQFTYAVNKDGSWSSDLVPGSFDGVFQTGPRTGQHFTVDQLSFTGMLSNNNKEFTLASATTVIETITFLGPPLASHQRICHRSRVGIAVQPGNGNP